MNRDTTEYQKVMNGLGQIPGLNLPIPGVTRSGYKPGIGKKTADVPAFSTPAPVMESESERKTLSEARLPLSKNDKQLLLQTLKIFFENHASQKTQLSESNDVFATLSAIAERNGGNQYLHRTLTALFEASKDFDLARGHLRMVIKNTAEYIKSM